MKPDQQRQHATERQVQVMERIVQWFSAFELLSFITQNTIDDHVAGIPNLHEDIMSHIEQLCHPPMSDSMSDSDSDNDDNEQEEERENVSSFDNVPLGYLHPKTIAPIVHLLNEQFSLLRAESSDRVRRRGIEEQQLTAERSRGTGKKSNKSKKKTTKRRRNKKKKRHNGDESSSEIDSSDDDGSGSGDAIVDDENDESDNLFLTLVRAKVPLLSFCTLIGIILAIPGTSEMYQSNIHPLLQLWLSRLYLCLLRNCSLLSHGEQQSQLFNSFTLRSIVTLYKMCLTEKLQYIDEDWTIVPVVESPANNNRNKRRKTQKQSKSKQRKVVVDDDTEKQSSNDNVPHNIQLETSKQMPLLLNELCNFLQVCSLNDKDDDIFEYVIEKISDCTRSQLIYSGSHKLEKQESAEIYRALFQLLRACTLEIHGDQSENLNCVLGYLLDNLTVKIALVRQTSTEFVVGLSTANIPNYSQSLIAFIQHALIRIAAAKSDKRGSGISFLCDKSEFLYSDKVHIHRIVSFLSDLVRSKQSSNRLIALEFAVRVLIKLIQQTPVDDVEEEEDIAALLLLVTSRTTDKIANIRTKALNCYVSLFDHSESDKSFKTKLTKILSPDVPVADDEEEPNSPVQQPVNENSFDDEIVPFQQTPKKVSIAEDISQSAMTASCGFIGSRTIDASAMVRKAAIQVIEGMIGLNPKVFLKSQFIDVIKKHALDISVANRRQSIVSITQLMNKFPENNYIHKTAITVLLVCSFDGESSVCEKALELVNSNIFSQIASKKNDENSQVWELLEDISEEHHRLLCKSCSVLISKKEISSKIVKHIIAVLKEKPLRSGWCLLDILSTHFPKQISTEFLTGVFEEKNQCTELTDDDSFVFDKCLTILSRVYDNLSQETKQMLSDAILTNLIEFRINTNLVRSHVMSLYNLCNNRSQTDAMYNRLINKSYSELHKYVLSYSEDADPHLLSKYLFTIGEVSMSFARISTKIVTLVQALIASSVTTAADESTIGLRSTPSKKAQIPALVRAHAFATLGKMCLIDEALAKKSVPLFIREIEKSSDESVRNNVVIVMCDLCVKYTSVVDRYIAKISESMCDKSPLVRRNALSLLTQVIAEDFVKWKPLILFRFLFKLTDQCEVVSKYAEYALCVVLPRKNPTLLFNHMIDAIFVFNRCSSHPSHNNYLQSERELSLFNCSGPSPEQIARRFQIYKFLLHQLSSEQILDLHVRLHSDVLGMFADESIPIHADVLTDILNMLSWPQFKLRSITNVIHNEQNHAMNDMNEEEQEVTTKVGSIQGKLIEGFLKKHISEVVIPIIVELKRTLEKKRSPLLRQVMLYLQLIMSEYKNESSNFLIQDKQTAKEIEFDLKRISAQKEAHLVNRRISTPSSTTKVPFCTPVRSPYPTSNTNTMMTPSRRRSSVTRPTPS